ncbi:MAG: efflux RND transporter permease subunit, partial [Pirellulales bacterium]
INADRPVISTTNLANRPVAWFILTPRPPSQEQIADFVRRHPHLADALRSVQQAHNTGLLLYRLRRAINDHPEAPELRELLPNDVEVPKLRKFAEDVIEAAFERVEGVALANVIGGRQEELQVIVDPHKLAARQLTIANVRDVLRAENQDTSGGDFSEGKRRQVVRTIGQFDSPEDVANVILARRDGAPVYVRDVAEVQLGHRKPDGLTRRFGSTTLAINAQRKVGHNLMDAMAGLRQTVGELNEGVLLQRGLFLEQVYDETDYIQSSIDLVTDNIAGGAVLTFITLLLFLRSGRSTLIIGLHIAISTMGAFLAMYLMGRSLNVLCLGGLAFAVGMLVDNAIVMLENIYRRNEMGEPPVEAAVRGAKEVWGALLNASVVNLAVFFPILFIQQEAGQLFRDIALAICASVGLSLIVAITVVPTMAARFLRNAARRREAQAQELMLDGQPATVRVPRAAGSKFAVLLQPRALWQRIVAWLNPMLLAPLDRFGAAFVRLVIRVNEYLQRGLAFRIVIVTVFVGTSIVLTWLMWPKVEYLPNGNRNLVIGIILPPPGYNIEHLTEMGTRVEERLRPYWETEPGTPEAAKLPFPPIADYFYVVRGRQIFMGLRSAEPLRAAELVPLVQQVTSDLPGTLVVPRQASLFEQGLTAGRTIDIEIAGPDVQTLVGIGGRMMGQLMGPGSVVPNARVMPRPSLDLANPEVHVLRKKEQAADMDVNTADLGYMVDALVDGAYVTDYYAQGSVIDLVIKGEDKYASRTQHLASLPVATRGGSLVELGALATIVSSSGPEQINRRERIRAITILVTPAPEMPLEEAMQKIEEHIVAPLNETPEMKSGLYRVSLSGTADKLRQTWDALWFNLILAVVITYLTMAAMFESWLYPFVIITSVPLGAVGGFAGLWLLNHVLLMPFGHFQPLDVLTMLGFVMLIGTVVNNPILIVEQALIHMREEGMPQGKAILQSVRSRIRPIFMTTLSGLIGLLPLVVSPGAGSELYRGIGAVLLGGMIVSTIFTLVLVPTLFSLLLDLKELATRRYSLNRSAEFKAVEPPATDELDDRQESAVA